MMSMDSFAILIEFSSMEFCSLGVISSDGANVADHACIHITFICISTFSMNFVAISIILVVLVNSFTILVKFSSMKFLSLYIICSNGTYVTDHACIHLALGISIFAFSMDFVTISIILVMSVNSFAVLIVLGSVKLFS